MNYSFPKVHPAYEQETCFNSCASVIARPKCGRVDLFGEASLHRDALQLAMKKDDLDKIWANVKRHHVVVPKCFKLHYVEWRVRTLNLDKRLPASTFAVSGAFAHHGWRQSSVHLRFWRRWPCHDEGLQGRWQLLLGDHTPNPGWIGVTKGKHVFCSGCMWVIMDVFWEAPMWV